MAVNFKVTMAEEDLPALESHGLKKKFNLVSTINLSNMVSSIPSKNISCSELKDF